MDNRPEIKTVKVGMLDTNCYILSDGKEAVVIDPGDEVDKILRELDGLKLKKIILTHLHFDHVIAVRELKVKTGAKVFCHKADLEILDEALLAKNEIDGFFGRDARPCVSTFKIIETPGHTPGGICLYAPVGAYCDTPILFSGDTIFKGSIGVTHYKGGNFGKIKDSIEKKLLALPDDTMVYPGHGEAFLLGDEKEEIKNVLIK